MSEKALKILLKTKANEFMKNKRNVEALRTVIESFKVSIIGLRLGKTWKKFYHVFTSSDRKQKVNKWLSHLTCWLARLYSWIC